MLSLHLPQVSLVYVNTLTIQQVLAEPEWCGHLTAADRCALSPLAARQPVWHVCPGYARAYSAGKDCICCCYFAEPWTCARLRPTSSTSLLRSLLPQ